MYSYKLLPEKHIRLTTIHPGEFNDDIVVSLEPTTLSVGALSQYEDPLGAYLTLSEPGLAMQHVIMSIGVRVWQ